MLETINVGLIGYGTVGRGTVKSLMNNAKIITENTGITYRVKAVADLKIDEFQDDEYIKQIPVKTKNVDDILNDDDIHIVVELIGGYTFAKDFIIKALKKGKHVVTANKALLALHGQELFAIAKESGTDIGFEGSVAGGIPIIRVLKEDLAANNVHEISGLINGTANYILTEMETKGKEFEEVLAEAQKLGYAEADPTFDVEGIDTAHKIAILASIGFNTIVPFDQVFVEGISSIKQVDIEFAKKLDCRIKLLAVAKKNENDIEVRVHPAMLPLSHQLANVNGVFNAVSVRGNMVDRIVNIGRGAGSEPTGSAVAGDIISIGRNIACGCPTRVPVLGYTKEYKQYYPVRDIKNVASSFYVRFSVMDEPGHLGRIATILGDHGVSIAQAMQTIKQMPGEPVPVVFMTHEVMAKNLQDAIAEILEQGIVKVEPVVIRVKVA